MAAEIYSSSLLFPKLGNLAICASMDPSDVERDPPEARRDDYPSIAAWMACDQDNETFIYRKFDELSARNLLNMQSEVIELEAKLKALDEETRQGTDTELKQSARKWETFRKNAASRDQERVRMELAKEIRSKLREYREYMILRRPSVLLISCEANDELQTRH